MNKAREVPLAEDPFDNNVKYVAGFVADKFVPASTTMKAFLGMSLAEIKKYHQVVEQCCKDYLEVC